LYKKLNNNIADRNLFFLMVKNAVGNLNAVNVYTLSIDIHNIRINKREKFKFTACFKKKVCAYRDLNPGKKTFRFVSGELKISAFLIGC
jgi:hypothetical protein